MSASASLHELYMEVATGLHILQPYANEYWISHLIRYVELLEAKGSAVPPALLAQLEQLASLSWKSRGSVTLASMLEQVDLERLANQASVLRKIPSILDIVYEIIKFRTILTKKEHLQKSVRGKQYTTTAWG